MEINEKLMSARKSPVKKKLCDSFKSKPNWNPQGKLYWLLIYAFI